MLLYSNFRQNFYEIVRKQHTLIIVSADVDALCASVILTYALSCDDATFSLSPVESWNGIEKAVKEHKDQIHNLVLINCGVMQSLLSLLDNVKVFVLDSHRPVHLDNIYSGESPINVLVFSDEIENWNVPEASEIYNDESDEEKNDGVKETNESGDRQDIANVIEKRAMKKQRRTIWKRNRATLMWNYYMNSWYSTSSAVFMLELVHELGKSNSEMMWCAAVGLTSQFIDHLISVETYTNVCIDRMRGFIRKFAPKKPIKQTRGDGVLRITFDKELILPLYSHWSIYQSMCYDTMFICQSKLWTQKGEHNLKYILAKLGLTLAECRQDFAAMNSDRRTEVFEVLEKHMDASFAAFSAFFSYSTRYNSADFARVLSLRLECKAQTKRRSLYERFANSNSVLHQFLKFGGRETPDLEKMFNGYKVALKELNSLVFLSINQSHIISTARYFLLDLQQCSSLSYLTSRHCLNFFIHLLLRAFASSKSSRRTTKPLIIAVPLQCFLLPNEEGTTQNDLNTAKENLTANSSLDLWYLIVGIMPLADILSDIQRKNVLGRAFDHVVNEIKIEVEREGFDSNMIKIRADDRTKFFNGLEARLEII